MTERCHWVYDRDVPGGKFWVPGCWGGLYDPAGYYCPSKPRATKDELKDLILKMSKRLDDLEARLPPRVAR